MFYALHAGLSLVMEEGVERRLARHQANHLKLVAGLEALGMQMLVQPGIRMWALHTPRVPEGISDVEVRKKLLGRHGIEILGGFGPLAGKVFRIGLMGEGSTSANVDLLLGALKEAVA
jgi:alanine-glyoxylate transaminase/serine-glyoxylate transaminase/serine-pyruvate transaminase